jgi:hypothetical protein
MVTLKDNWEHLESEVYNPKDKGDPCKHCQQQMNTEEKLTNHISRSSAIRSKRINSGQDDLQTKIVVIAD